jgi:hypothetical protein
MMVKSEESLSTVNEKVVRQKGIILFKDGMKNFQVCVLWNAMIEV